MYCCYFRTVDWDKVRKIEDALESEPPYEGDLGEFEEVFVKKHNYYRRKHHAPPLVWSEKCAEHARKWVKYLVDIDALTHDDDFGMGESCGYFNSSNAQNKEDTEWADSVCDMWYNEVGSYNFRKNDYQPQTGHFTQMVWISTKKVGCAMKKKGNKVFVVANYYPPGNFIGRYAENVEKD